MESVPDGLLPDSRHPRTPTAVQSLFARATRLDVVACRLPSRRELRLRRLAVRFGRASPEYLRPGTLAPSYVAKPLVTFQGAAMFGELAVLRWLERDGWQGVWVDTAHGRKFWREMPHRAAPVPLPAGQRELYDAIVALNGGRASGFFDVMAWRDRQMVFVDYEAPGERPGRTRAAWMDAALTAGISEHDLLLVTAADE